MGPLLTLWSLSGIGPYGIRGHNTTSGFWWRRCILWSRRRSHIPTRPASVFANGALVCHRRSTGCPLLCCNFCDGGNAVAIWFQSSLGNWCSSFLCILLGLFAACRLRCACRHRRIGDAMWNTIIVQSQGVSLRLSGQNRQSPTKSPTTNPIWAKP